MVATGKEPSLPELFLKTHKKKDTGEFDDKRSAQVVVRTKTSRGGTGAENENSSCLTVRKDPTNIKI
ncbi:uncharacterized protein G2W53_044412 [Senna tora]|uniref:Uncharacterized protein n=1 Tax=Senna tora TaxID=362788 RepID=A0A834VX37_9FABA|nr:uncharacterized protein G2W53_044412 [Senna tora]